MKRNSFLVLMLALVLVGSAWAATAKHPSHMSGVSQMSGKIESFSKTELTLSSTVNGKAQQETFVINPDTKTSGTLNNGERATVRYKNENGQKIATMIHAHKMASKSASTSSSASTPKSK